LTTTTTTTTTIKKIPAPESYVCLWCKREIPAGEESLLVEIGGTSLYSCMECGGHVKIPKRPSLHVRTLEVLGEVGGAVTGRMVAERLGMEGVTGPTKASTALRFLWKEGLLTRNPGQTTSGSLVYEYTLAPGEGNARQK
jgi:DNA-directed RNA polymerase subunit RPC12/RpoP